MNSTDLYELFRSDVDDKERPYLWSDEEVWAYLNDALTMFVRLTGGIPDMSTPSVCEVAVAEGEAVSPLHPSILRIMSAMLVSNGREIEILNAPDLGRMTSSDYGSVRPLLANTTPGPVTAMVIGMERNKARLLGVPQENDTISLHVYRLPLAEITGEGQSLDEIERVHHFHLLKWMKSLAYRKQDAETFDRTRADENEMLFRAYCNEAKAESERYKHKNRVVAYGGY